MTWLFQNAVEIVLITGLAGSLIEKVGDLAKVPAITKFGRILESIGTDLPKLLSRKAV